MSAALARNRLGVPAVVFFVLSAAAPLTVVAGVIPNGFAVTGVTGIPVAFLAVGAVIAVFAVGYVAMSRRISNAGAFYTYVARGLGRPAGVAASTVALLAYNALQIALYGAFGVSTAALLEQHAGWTLPWWVCALAGWCVVAVLGVLRVDLNGAVLAVLLTAEIAIVVLFSITDLQHPDGDTITYATLSPGNLLAPGVGAVLVIAVLGFVGFEGGAVYAEETKDPRRTVPVATYLAVALIAGLYTLAAWSMTVLTGPDRIVPAVRGAGPDALFLFATTHLGTAVADLGRTLFVTSLFAALLSFHNTTARYLFALGREHVLPPGLGRTSARTGAPVVGSIVQNLLGLAVIVLWAITGWDPLVQLFFWGGTAGGLGVLVLLTGTSVAVVAYFARHRDGESRWTALVAPGTAAVLLAGILVLALANYATLLGVPPDHPLRWGIPAAYAVVALAGAGWALLLRRRRPDVYAVIGLGANSAAGRATQTGGLR